MEIILEERQEERDALDDITKYNTNIEGTGLNKEISLKLMIYFLFIGHEMQIICLSLYVL